MVQCIQRAHGAAWDINTWQLKFCGCQLALHKTGVLSVLIQLMWLLVKDLVFLKKVSE